MKTEKQRVIEHLIKHLSDGLDEASPTETPAASRDGQALMLRFLPVREQRSDEVIAPGTLVRIETAGRESWVLVVPSHGGLVTDFEELPLQVVTPHSPLGEALLGRRAGESVELSLRNGGKRITRIVGVS